MSLLDVLIGICMLDRLSIVYAQTNSTADSSADSADDGSSSGTPIVELVIVGCAILLLVISTVKIGFLLRSPNSRQPRQGK